MINKGLLLSSAGAPPEETLAKLLAGDRPGFRNNPGPRPGLVLEPAVVRLAPQQAQRQSSPALRLSYAVQGHVAVESPAESTAVRAALAESHIGAVAAAARADPATSAEAATAEGSDAGQRRRDSSGATLRQHGFEGAG